MASSPVSCIRVISLIVVLFSILVYIIHNAAPYLPLECVAISVSCPITKSYGTINDDKSGDAIHVKHLKQIMQQWVRDGYSTGSQCSVFINNQERLNIFAKDDRKYPHFDRNSLVPVFSATSNFAAMLMGIAIQNKWIASLDDAVTDYWPQFPTHRLVLPFKTWLAYYDEYSSTKSNINHHTLAQYCNQRSIHIDIKRYHVKIKDVLRHESGYGLLLSNMEITTSTTTYQDIKSMIEGTEYLIQFKETPRSYHVITRGFILNQIFMNVEPKHRSMSEYYQQEIVPTLESQNMNADEEFVLLFEGLKHNPRYMNPMYPMTQPPMYWNLYHVALPGYLGYDRPFNHAMEKQWCASSVMNQSMCSNISLSKVQSMKTRTKQMPSGTGRFPEWGDVSKSFMGDMRMGYMSVSLVSNAYSIAKTVSHVLFSGEVMNEYVLRDIVSGNVEQWDTYLGFRTTFSKGGFAHISYDGVDWYGWPGWGGSIMYFAPKYKCVVAFTVTASDSPHYNPYDTPRQKTIMNLVSLQLLHDADSK